MNGEEQVVEGDETSREHRARGRRVVDAILSRHANDDVVLMFTHGGIMGHILAALMGTNRTWGLGAQNTAPWHRGGAGGGWGRQGQDSYSESGEGGGDRVNDSSHRAQLG